jgi:uncharacterized protein (DUF697 family)/GTPase Era involved in 16S rRNA processing
VAEGNDHGPAFQELRELVEESRPPILFLMGRSGHGKSSLINALAGKSVAEVGDVKPTTPESIPYLISFPETFASWQVIDTRGIFETTRPDGAPTEDALRVLERDILAYKPDVLLHTIAAPEVRNLRNDLEVRARLMNAMKARVGTAIPVLLVLTRADGLGRPREWPPEQHAAKAGQIVAVLDYLSRDVITAKHSEPLDKVSPVRGRRFEGADTVAVVPVCTLDGEDQWNVDTLSELIGNELPKSARLDFYQAQKRKGLLQQLSSATIARFSAIAGTVGASPIPIADTIVLTPLQALMIAIVAGLSCRKVTLEVVGEYATAVGAGVAGAYALRELARQIMKIVPGAGPVVSGAVAAAGTYAIGKSAEAYFFTGEIRQPGEFVREWFSGAGKNLLLGGV